MFSKILAATIIAVSLAALSSTGSAQRSGVRLGKIDRTFGDQGSSIVPSGGGVFFPGDSIILSDGKMVLLNTVQQGSIFRVQVTKLLSTGLPDEGFGEKGHALFPFGTEELAWAIIEQPDGKLVVGGYTGSFFEHYDFLVFRLTANGQLDLTFGDDGAFIKDFAVAGQKGFTNDRSGSLTLLPDGKILVSGTSDRTPASGPVVTYATLVRLNANGTIDETYSNNGLSQYPIGNNVSVATSFQRPAKTLIQEDGKILVGIIVEREDPEDPDGYGMHSIVVRFDANGTIDSNFGNGGLFIPTPYEGFNLSTMALLPNGKSLVMLIGILIRLNANGTVDTTFGTNGFCHFGWNARSLAISSDQKITIAGFYYQGRAPEPGFSQMGRLERLYSNGEPELRFGRGGATIFQVDEFDTVFSNLHILQDKYIVTGMERTGFRPIAARFFATK